MDTDGILDEPMHVVLHARHLRELLLLGHVVVDEPESAVEGHGDGHAGFGHRVHVGGHQRDIQVQSIGQACVDLALLGKDLRVEGGQRDVVVGQGRSAVCCEEPGGRLIELGIDLVVWARICHARWWKGSGFEARKLKYSSAIRWMNRARPVNRVAIPRPWEPQTNHRPWRGRSASLRREAANQ